MPPLEVRTGVTVGDVIGTGTARLAAAGWADARHEAALLWAGLHDRSVGAIWLEQDQEVTDGDAARYTEAVERRGAGEPLAYVLGTAGFRTLGLMADARALIPRPETEGLVGLVLERMHARFGRSSWGTAADVGTGSGCIALSLAVEGAFERIVATDLSADALMLARDNVRRVAPATPIDLRWGDLLAPLVGARLHAIVSNPPYVSEPEMRSLSPAVREHEPVGALVSGADGLMHTRRLLEAAGDYLIEGGLLAVEVDSRRADRVRAMADRAGWTKSRIYRDLFGRSRYLLTTKE